MKKFESSTFLQLKAYCRGEVIEILVANPYEFVVRCGDLEEAKAMVTKFSNAAKGTIGYGDPTQVLFIPC